MADAITRKEILLKSISGGTSSNVIPITREEQYLSYIAGESSEKPSQPITREEYFLNKISTIESSAQIYDGNIIIVKA